MELDELKQSWHAMAQRLDQQDAFNVLLFTESRLDKAKHHLRWLLFGQVLQIVIGALVTVVFARYWIAHREVLPLLAFGLGMHAWGVLLICSAVVEVLLITRIQYAQPVLTVQRYLALLLRWRARVAPWLGLPFLLLWTLGPLALIALGAPLAPAWVAANLVISLIPAVALWWFYRRSHRPGRELQARRIDDFLGGESLRLARIRLDEIKEFERDAAAPEVRG